MVRTPFRKRLRVIPLGVRIPLPPHEEYSDVDKYLEGPAWVRQPALKAAEG